MFSGIIQEIGKVKEFAEEISGFKLGLEVKSQFLSRLTKGDSISVNGTCLTVVNLSYRTVYFDVIHETLRATNLKDLEMGSLVNLERSLKYGGEIGGHLLSGHIYGVSFASILNSGNEIELVIEKPAELSKYIFNKGYIAINGASLTIAKNGKDSLSIFLIPETINSTNLGKNKEPFLVNIEVDSQTVAIVDTTERINREKRIVE
ncbi:MAG: riboflavin synthase subunit alpha [SAR86 cluster bacterium]|jgi:riboflavin synthase|nr:riboflavin synthase subunit alpha [SAR86 cluster bacterium]|tara:strand:- start:20260 stop:20874 length:615 start_codon:yes stop_codon:yes gene_type:complete